jgi:hypothetical protein
MQQFTLLPEACPRMSQVVESHLGIQTRAVQEHTRTGTVDISSPAASSPFVLGMATHKAVSQCWVHPYLLGWYHGVCCTMMLQASRHPHVSLCGGDDGMSDLDSRHQRFAHSQPRGVGRGCAESA